MILALIQILLATAAWAQSSNSQQQPVGDYATTETECSPVDMSNEFGPVRNQASIGWCYAFSGADLIGHYLGLQPPNMVSAMDVGVAWSMHNSKDHWHAPDKDLIEKNGGKRMEDRHGGDTFTAPVYNYFARGRLCLESKIPSESMFQPPSKSYLGSKDDWERTKWISNRMDDYYKKFNLNIKPEPQPSRALFPERRNLYFENQCRPAAPFNVRDVSYYLNDWATASIRMKHDSMCKKDQRLKNHPLVLQELNDDLNPRKAAYLNSAADRLLKDRQPFSIGYNVCPFEKPERVGFAKDCPHASVVIGRQWNKATNSCDYMIRNSWGRGCDAYRTDLKCVDGNFWVPGKELFQNTTAMMALLHKPLSR